MGMGWRYINIKYSYSLNMTKRALVSLIKINIQRFTQLELDVAGGKDILMDISLRDQYWCERRPVLV